MNSAFPRLKSRVNTREHGFQTSERQSHAELGVPSPALLSPDTTRSRSVIARRTPKQEQAGEKTAKIGKLGKRFYRYPK